MKTKLLFISMFWIGNVCFSQNTYVPDDNFENYLETHSMGNGISNDDTVLTANINAVTDLNVNSMNISDFTGIEDFTDLTALWCNDNNLSTLDVSQNTALTTLYCSSNNLSMLNVSQNLTFLRCNENNLSTLDLSQNIALTWLRCDSNNLSSLNVKNGNNVNFSYFNALNNPTLYCIDVDDATYSTSNWFSIDSQASFSEDCSTLSSNNSSLFEFSIYPNPVNELLTIDLNIDANYSLMNLNGQVFKTGSITNKENTIDVSILSAGLYFIKVKTEKGIITKKLIKQ